MTMTLAFLIPFLLISILNIFFVKNNIRLGILLTKPLLMPVLAFFYLINVWPVNYLVVFALAFGFLGDVFLLWDNKHNCILAGIGAFLVGHIFYIFIFVGNSYAVRAIPIWFFLFVLSYIAAAILLLRKLFSSMQSMKLPAVAYMSVIFIMSFMSFSRILTVSFLSFLFTFLGSLAFILSDVLLAFNMITVKRKTNDVVIMATYILAQLFIILGLLI